MMQKFEEFINEGIDYEAHRKDKEAKEPQLIHDFVSKLKKVDLSKTAFTGNINPSFYGDKGQSVPFVNIKDIKVSMWLGMNWSTGAKDFTYQFTIPAGTLFKKAKTNQQFNYTTFTLANGRTFNFEDHDFKNLDFRTITKWWEN